MKANRLKFLVYHVVLLFSAHCCLGDPPAAAGVPDSPFGWSPSIPNNLGTQTGGGFGESDSKAIHQLGLRWLRIECGWSSMENPKNSYHYAEFDKLISLLLAEQIEPIVILDYGNPLYQDVNGTGDVFCGPTTSSAQEGYANFCGKTAAHLAQLFPKHRFVYEIWNEPNFKLFWHPTPNAKAYTNLCHLAYAAIKSSAPETTVMGPATSSATDRFIGECIDDGLLDSIDALSIHPYRRRAPETAVADYAALRKLIANRNAKDGKPDRKVPLVSSEWGYTATTDKSVSISCDPPLQAPYLARMWLINVWQDIAVSIWFQWKGGSDQNPDPWSKFGLLQENGTPRPSFTAAQTMIWSLNGYHCTGRMETQNKADYLLHFENGTIGRSALAAWTTASPHAIEIPSTQEKVDLVTMLGSRTALSAHKGSISLQLSPEPIYVLPSQ